MLLRKNVHEQRLAMKTPLKLTCFITIRVPSLRYLHRHAALDISCYQLVVHTLYENHKLYEAK